VTFFKPLAILDMAGGVRLLEAVSEAQGGQEEVPRKGGVCD
jgi:hypothetical protein